MVRRRSTVRFRKGGLRGLHVSVRLIFTFGSDILVRSLAWLWPLPCRVRSCPPGGFLRARERLAGMLALSACSVRVLPEVLAAGAVPACGRTPVGGGAGG